MKINSIEGARHTTENTEDIPPLLEYVLFQCKNLANSLSRKKNVLIYTSALVVELMVFFSKEAKAGHINDALPEAHIKQKRDLKEQYFLPKGLTCKVLYQYESGVTAKIKGLYVQEGNITFLFNQDQPPYLYELVDFNDFIEYISRLSKDNTTMAGNLWGSELRFVGNGVVMLDKQTEELILTQGYSFIVPKDAGHYQEVVNIITGEKIKVTFTVSNGKGGMSHDNFVIEEDSKLLDGVNVKLNHRYTHGILFGSSEVHTSKNQQILYRRKTDHIHGYDSVEKNGDPVVYKIHGEFGDFASEYRGDLYFFEPDGKKLYNFPTQQRMESGLSIEKYMERLARVLNTHERLDVFYKLNFNYVADSGSSDFWQTAEQTLQRIDGLNGNLVGDCDDISFLAQKMLQLNNIPAFVVYTNNHASCIWIEEKKSHQGTAYTFRSMSTQGSYEVSGTDFDQLFAKTMAYCTIAKDQYEFLRLTNFDQINVLEIGTGGERIIIETDVSIFKDPENIKIFKQIKALYIEYDYIKDTVFSSEIIVLAKKILDQYLILLSQDMNNRYYNEKIVQWSTHAGEMKIKEEALARLSSNPKENYIYVDQYVQILFGRGEKKRAYNLSIKALGEEVYSYRSLIYVLLESKDVNKLAKRIAEMISFEAEDYFYEYLAKNFIHTLEQKKLFEKALTKLPTTIHSRYSKEETVSQDYLNAIKKGLRDLDLGNK